MTTVLDMVCVLLILIMLATDFVTDLTDWLWVGDGAWLATDFVTDLTDWLWVGDGAWLATDFVTDLTDWLLVGDSRIILQLIRIGRDRANAPHANTVCIIF